jgi:hypothetical protein
MAIVSCKECNAVSTAADVCPHCGAPQQQSAPPPLPIQQKEEIFYSDSTVVVTGTRVIIGGITYALRNITSVSMRFSPPKIFGAVLLLLIGAFILLAAFLTVHGTMPAPFGAYVIAPVMIVGGILWICNLKTKYHVHLSTAAGEIHVLSSWDRAYIEHIVLSINEAIAK